MSLSDKMRAVDVAWNERRWDDYRAHFAPDFRGWMDADTAPHDLEEHVRRGQGARKLVVAAERVDVLPHHQRTGTRKPQLAV